MARPLTLIHVVSGDVVGVGHREHGVVLELRLAVFPAAVTSLAFPERRALRVDLYPRMTVSEHVSVEGRSGAAYTHKNTWIES